MTGTATALYNFFSSFDIPAYITDNIPDNATMPYITYDLVEPEPLATGYLNASVWYRGTSVSQIAAKVDSIKAAIGNGVSLTTPTGVIHLFRARDGAFAKIMNDPNRETKRALLSMIIHCNTQ